MRHFIWWMEYYIQTYDYRGGCERVQLHYCCLKSQRNTCVLTFKKIQCVRHFCKWVLLCYTHYFWAKSKAPIKLLTWQFENSQIVPLTFNRLSRETQRALTYRCPRDGFGILLTKHSNFSAIDNEHWILLWNVDGDCFVSVKSHMCWVISESKCRL